MKKIILGLIGVVCFFVLGCSNVTVYAQENNIKDYENMTEEEIQEKIDELFKKAESDTITIESKSKNRGSSKLVPKAQSVYCGGDKVRLTIKSDNRTLVCENVSKNTVFVCDYKNSYAGYNCGTRDSIGCCQGLMNCNGAALAVDGIFGPNTYNAVLRFQRANSNLANDGIAGPKTFALAVLFAFSHSQNA